ncbi:NF038105 family protein [Acinetobacter puyangensis]|uniref:Uncharacterized protein n=1 Tax=Acinetobacter puyangensis TaxID=1096779 RepID=A0A240E4L1_9GAMM|nr:NF038105 family protein [Acinetobacter puyangensis]SNX43506.1 hypothetical protein SAMN05421731_101548 [Acinetobacter puyangensis]
MTTVKFDQVPTDAESTTVTDIQQDSVKQAWQGYESKPEYKKFNKHDMIESMLPHASDQDENLVVQNEK